MKCAICGDPCTPLADYDSPTCYRCDAAMERITVRANDQEIAAGVWNRPRTHRHSEHFTLQGAEPS